MLSRTRQVIARCFFFGCVFRHPDCVWQEQDIVIQSLEVSIRPPYDPSCVSGRDWRARERLTSVVRRAPSVALSEPTVLRAYIQKYLSSGQPIVDSVYLFLGAVPRQISKFRQKREREAARQLQNGSDSCSSSKSVSREQAGDPRQ